MIELHTLGDAVIRVGNKEVRPTSPMVFAALLYLCVERGRRVPRAALQELLFPETDERSGAHSLRQLLYKLRQLGVPLEVDASSVMIAAAEVRDDYSSIAIDSTPGRAAMAALTTGFAAGFAPGFSQSFDEWLDRQRAACSATVRRRLLEAMTSARQVFN